MTDPHKRAQIDRLLNVMERLRDPETGCPWDIAQTSQSIAQYTIEEAYEVVDAIEQGDVEELKSELGDLLLQVVFHAQMSKEKGQFSFDDVAAAISEKMEERHPHIFGDLTDISAEDVRINWEALKEKERRDKAQSGTLDGIAMALPALVRAYKLQKRASRVGFDWNDPQKVMRKIQEECAELTEAKESLSHDAIEDEFGDILFAVVNLGRHLGVEAENALKRTNAKFTHRFEYIEAQLSAQGVAIQDASLDQMEALWQAAKSISDKNNRD